MLTHASHAGGVDFKTEIQFRTRFDYMFPVHARSPDCVLPAELATLDGLLLLGDAMADPGVQGGGADPFDSGIPAGFTYLGQFIDHDITARTDRELFESRIAELDGTPRAAKPVDPDQVVAGLTNGRRPHLDLDSVYGDGPGLVAGVRTTARALYEADLALKVVPTAGKFDLPRQSESGMAIIADMRNDENVIISQLHAAFLAFGNAVRAGLDATLSDQARYSRARQFTRWAYQAVVINDYLPTVCDPAVVADILMNGPRFFAPLVDGEQLFMPLEFSIAGFRFGHSMIRPAYKLNDISFDMPIQNLFGVKDLTTGMPRKLPDDLLVEWDNFVGTGAQRARRIDARLSAGLFVLPFGPNLFMRLAQRNLLRGYMLSIPTGQAIAHAMGIEPLSKAELIADDKVAAAFHKGCFYDRTPLWYYVLQEADVQKDGQSLGAVGSRIVAETLIGLIKHDPNGVFQAHDSAVSIDDDGLVSVEVPAMGGTAVSDLDHLLEVAGVL